LLIGGERPQLSGEMAGGYFYKPTVLKGNNKMRVFQEEIFGPVLAVTTFKDEAEALEIANDTIYGLGAGVWTRDISRAHKVARALKAGTVWVNTYLELDVGSPFGGYKQSGIGRELGKHSIELYTQVKSVFVKL
jgi:aldehyde dehydrogenase